MVTDSVEPRDPEADKEEDEEESSQPPHRMSEEMRKHKNRQSAAKSRVQKRAYISQLEARVLELSTMAQVLTVENFFWKSLNLVRDDATCPLVACKGFLVVN